jgi:hypothetical protein
MSQARVRIGTRIAGACSGQRFLGEIVIMAKIKVIKSGKGSAKPQNFCPWVIDSDDPAPQK